MAVSKKISKYKIIRQMFSCPLAQQALITSQWKWSGQPAK